jgi:hypothetical protein
MDDRKGERRKILRWYLTIVAATFGMVAMAFICEKITNNTTIVNVVLATGLAVVLFSAVMAEIGWIRQFCNALRRARGQHKAER